METTFGTQSEKASQSQSQSQSQNQTQSPAQSQAQQSTQAEVIKQSSSTSEVKKGQLGDPEYEVRQFMNNYAQAVREGNVDEILSFFSDDVEAFECPPPLAFHGIREYSQNWKYHHASEFNSPVTYDFTGERIFANEKLATFTSLLHVRGQAKKNEEEVESWIRLTCVLEKSQGYWQIVHEHMSFPVTEEGCALMNLSPDEIQTH